MITSVARVEFGVGIGVELPLLVAPEWMRDSDFRFERPAI